MQLCLKCNGLVVQWYLSPSSVVLLNFSKVVACSEAISIFIVLDLLPGVEISHGKPLMSPQSQFPNHLAESTEGCIGKCSWHTFLIL